MEMEEKRKKVRESLDEDDLLLFRQLAIERWGLVDNAFRKRIWPKLYAINPHNIQIKPDIKKLRAHKDYEQVVLDVNRSLKRFPPGMDDDVRLSLQDQLVELIMRVLVRNRDLHYYQGYHDICVTFLLVLDEDTAFALVEKLSRTHFRIFMGPDMTATSEQLQLIHTLVGFRSTALARRFEDAGLQPIYALSWVITWFGHVLGDVDRILRVYDFFLGVDHPLAPIYLSAALVLHRTADVLACEPDFALLHHHLSSLPEQPLPLEQLTSAACDLFLKHPPAALLAASKPQRSLLSSGAGVHRARRLKQTKLRIPEALRGRGRVAVISLLVLVLALLFSQYSLQKK